MISPPRQISQARDHFRCGTSGAKGTLACLMLLRVPYPPMFPYVHNSLGQGGGRGSRNPARQGSVDNVKRAFLRLLKLHAAGRTRGAIDSYAFGRKMTCN